MRIFVHCPPGTTAAPNPAQRLECAHLRVLSEAEVQARAAQAREAGYCRPFRRMRIRDCEPIQPRPGMERVPAAGAASLGGHGNGRAFPWRAGLELDPGHTAAASRRSPCAAATSSGASEFAQRLECARLRVLSACWCFRRAPLRSETSALRLPSFHDRSSGDPTTYTAGDPGSTPARGWVGPAQAASACRQQSSACRAPFALRSRRGGGGVARKPEPAPVSVGFPQKAAIHFLNNPPHSRDLCRSASRELWGRRSFG